MAGPDPAFIERTDPPRKPDQDRRGKSTRGGRTAPL